MRPLFAEGSPPKQQLADAWTALANYRRQVDAHRASLADTAAAAVLAELVELAPVRSDSDLEDELSARLGARLWEWEEGPLEDHMPPDLFAKAVIATAATAVRASLDLDLDLDPATAEPDGWQAPWRVLTALARIVPFSLSDAIDDVAEHLGELPGGHVLPPAPAGPTPTSQVLWARDAYGSRLGVTVAFSAPSGPDRWYLWDIDACGHEAFTVHSAYYPSLEQALVAWQAGVGNVAASETAFVPVDDPWLLVELLPDEAGFLRSGVENADQCAEYYRAMRLAEEAMKAVGPRGAAQPADLDAATAVTQFTAWLQTRPAGLPQQVTTELDVLVEELADSWRIGGPAALFGTCSPHRVALTVLHLRNYYRPEFADELVALLPDWTTWLAQRRGTPPHLAERCRPYALGEPHADVGDDDSNPNYAVRVVE